MRKQKNLWEKLETVWLLPQPPIPTLWVAWTIEKANWAATPDNFRDDKFHEHYLETLSCQQK